MWTPGRVKNRIIKTILLTASLVLITSCGDTTEPPPDTKPENLKPIAVISPATEQSIFVGETLTFQGDGSSDPDSNTPLSFNWTLTLNGAPNSVQTFTEANPNPFLFTETGVVTVSLVVTDSLGLESDLVSVTVIVNAMGANRAPNGEISYTNGNGTQSTGDLSVITGADVIFTGSATDPDNDLVTIFNWSIPTGVTVANTPSDSPFTASFTMAGTYVIALTVTDDKGATDLSPAEITVTVTDPPTNQKPVARISPPTTTTITVGDSITFMGDTSSDPDGNTPLSYLWTFSGSTTSIPNSVLENPAGIIFDQVDVVTVSLVVTDSLGLASDPTTVVITVIDPSVNQAPEGFISHDQGSGTANFSIVAENSVIFDSTVTDLEGDPITYAWVFEGATPATADSSGPITVKYENSGVYTASLKVSDDNGNTTVLTPVTISVMPKFKHLTVLTDENSDPNAATYTLNVDENVSVNIASPEGNWTTHMMRYNGGKLQLPPVIKAKRGDKITVKVTNNLTNANEITTVHWHGFKIPGLQDGGPDIAFGPGVLKTYTFDIVQPAASLWFHPHADGTTATQVYNGLAGAFIVTDDITDSLESNNQLPSGDHDIALLVQDRSFGPDNGNGVRELLYSPGGAGMGGGGMMGGGMLGNRVLVNGVETPVLEVDTRQYRFRLYNGSNARTYNFSLDNNADFYVVGTDGGLLNIPVLTNNIVLSAGERVEIVVDFSSLIGQQVMLVSSSGGMMGSGGSQFNVMRFDVNTAATDPVTLYSSLAALQLPSTPEILTRLTELDITVDPIIFNMTGGMGGSGFLIRDVAYDPNTVNVKVLPGATEIWEIINFTMMAHPFHAHAIQWQILNRGPTNGTLSPASGIDLGWVDTVLVQPGETVRIIGHFDPVVNLGKYMYHCHILEHEESGMMGIFEIAEPTVLP